MYAKLDVVLQTALLDGHTDIRTFVLYTLWALKRKAGLLPCCRCSRGLSTDLG